MSNNISEKQQSKPIHHTLIEDFVALLTGTFLVGFGVLLLQTAHVATGGTVGLAILIHKMSGLAFGVCFFAVNLPFYYLGYRRLGRQMILRTIVAVSLLSLMNELHSRFIHFESVNPMHAMVLANVGIGLGLLILFRHRASLGGFNLLALDIQERYGIAAGKLQLGLDSLVLLLSLLYLSIWTFALSIVGVVILNMILAMNFRKDRYVVS